MNRGDRAKLFAPFEALGGLKQALMRKEYEHERAVSLRHKAESFDDEPEDGLRFFFSDAGLDIEEFWEEENRLNNPSPKC